MSDIYEILYPVIILLKYSGLATCSVEGVPGNRFFQRINHFSIYKILVYTLSLLLTVSTVFLNTILARFNNVHSIPEYLITAKMIAFPWYIALVVLFNEVYGFELMEAWRSLAKVDQKMRQIKMKPNDQRMTRICTVLTTIMFALIAAVNVRVNIMRSLSWVSTVLLLVYSFYKIVPSLVVYCHLLIINHRFSVFNAHVDADKGEGENDFTKFAEIHERLCYVAAKVNKAYLAVVLVNTGIGLLAIVSQLYQVYSKSSAFVSIHVLDLLITLYLCDEFSKQANKIKKLLIKVLVRTKNDVSKKEINAFALQLLHYDSKITAGGWFNLDFTLLFTIVGAVSTYLVILIQFDMALQH